MVLHCQVLQQLNLPAHEFRLDDVNIIKAERPWEIAPPLHKIGTPRALFKKLKNEHVQALEKQFSGNQSHPS